MKKFILALTAMLTLSISANAMSYEQAREQALFLTDKMAYELNLTDDQYEAAYEVNLDYLMSINDYNDLYGDYWTQRNMDLSYILFDWQYRSYLAANYFYRPLYWDGGYWRFGVYARYPHRDYYYFGYPRFVANYRGNHSWYRNNGHSWYYGRQYGMSNSNGGRYMGMRDGFNQGNYGRGTRSFGNMSNRSRGGFASQQNYQTRSTNRSFGYDNSRRFGNSDRSVRESSTRATVRNGNAGAFGQGNSSNFGNSRSGNSFNSNGNSVPNRTFTPRNGSSTRSFGSSPSASPSTRSSNISSGRNSGSFGGNSSKGGGFGGGSRSGGNSGGGNQGGGSFGGHR